MVNPAASTYRDTDRSSPGHLLAAIVKSVPDAARQQCAGGF
jgi:hypothetical protein